jgi:hypothetical protein
MHSVVGRHVSLGAGSAKRVSRTELEAAIFMRSARGIADVHDIGVRQKVRAVNRAEMDKRA